MLMKTKIKMLVLVCIHLQEVPEMFSVCLVEQRKYLEIKIATGKYFYKNNLTNCTTPLQATVVAAFASLLLVKVNAIVLSWNVFSGRPESESKV